MEQLRRLLSRPRRRRQRQKQRQQLQHHQRGEPGSPTQQQFLSGEEHTPFVQVSRHGLQQNAKSPSRFSNSIPNTLRQPLLSESAEVLRTLISEPSPDATAATAAPATFFLADSRGRRKSAAKTRAPTEAAELSKLDILLGNVSPGPPPRVSECPLIEASDSVQDTARCLRKLCLSNQILAANVPRAVDRAVGSSDTATTVILLSPTLSAASASPSRPRSHSATGAPFLRSAAAAPLPGTSKARSLRDPPPIGYLGRGKSRDIDPVVAQCPMETSVKAAQEQDEPKQQSLPSIGPSRLAAPGEVTPSTYPQTPRSSIPPCPASPLSEPLCTREGPPALHQPAADATRAACAGTAAPLARAASAASCEIVRVGGNTKETILLGHLAPPVKQETEGGAPRVKLAQQQQQQKCCYDTLPQRGRGCFQGAPASLPRRRRHLPPARGLQRAADGFCSNMHVPQQREGSPHSGTVAAAHDVASVLPLRSSGRVRTSRTLAGQQQQHKTMQQRLLTANSKLRPPQTYRLLKQRHHPQKQQHEQMVLQGQAEQDQKLAFRDLEAPGIAFEGQGQCEHRQQHQQQHEQVKLQEQRHATVATQGLIGGPSIWMAKAANIALEPSPWQAMSEAEGLHTVFQSPNASIGMESPGLWTRDDQHITFRHADNNSRDLPRQHHHVQGQQSLYHLQPGLQEKQEPEVDWGWSFLLPCNCCVSNNRCGCGAQACSLTSCCAAATIEPQQKFGACCGGLRFPHAVAATVCSPLLSGEVHGRALQPLQKQKGDVRQQIWIQEGDLLHHEHQQPPVRLLASERRHAVQQIDAQLLMSSLPPQECVQQPLQHQTRSEQPQGLKEAEEADALTHTAIRSPTATTDTPQQQPRHTETQEEVQQQECLENKNAETNICRGDTESSSRKWETNSNTAGSTSASGKGSSTLQHKPALGKARGPSLSVRPRAPFPSFHKDEAKPS